jgi:hypothetical protein
MRLFLAFGCLCLVVLRHFASIGGAWSPWR